jgi:acetyl-CoA carboxylase biotin carboxyl carrier protein
MNFKEVQELIKLINKSNLTEFKLKDGEFELSIRTKKYGKAKQASVAQPQIVPVQTSMPATMPVQPVNVSAATTPPQPAASKDAKEPEAAAKPESDSANYLQVKSPMVGTFYRSSSPEKEAYVKIGDVIEKDQVVCIVEAMKLFNEIESEVAGKVVEILVDDATPVEYDQVLFLVDPNG